MDKEMIRTTKVAIFRNKKIRKTIYKNEWWFSIIDIVEALTESDRPRKYWSDLKTKLIKEGYHEVSEKIGQLKLEAPDGKMRETDCASTETLFRIIQSIPSPKAEPLKRWLARVGFERIQETEDPEIAINRAMQTYLKKGYSREWINQRLKSIEIRKGLTDEWEKREAKEGLEFAVLTDDITFAWAGLTTKQYKRHRGLYKNSP